jgi:hypothetical protein
MAGSVVNMSNQGLEIIVENQRRKAWPFPDRETSKSTKTRESAGGRKTANNWLTNWRWK